MLKIRCIETFVVSLMCVTGAFAQVRTLPTREQIDQIVHPTLSTTAGEGVRGEDVVLGEVDGSQTISVELTIRNYTNSRVAITELRTGCNCLRVVATPKSLQPNESMTLKALFNPMGRVGEFEHEIYIYTSLDAHHPTSSLKLSGIVTTTDRFAHLREYVGELRLSRKSVTLDGLRVGTTRSERIVVANSGDSDITPTARPRIEGLQFSLHPTTLHPGEEGEIVISYTPKRLPEQEIETIIMVEGCEARPTERMIKITIKR